MNHPDPDMNLDDLAATSDLAELLGVGPSTISNYRRRHGDFPKPIVTVARGSTPLFDRRAVVRWWSQRTNPDLLQLLTEVER